MQGHETKEITLISTDMHFVISGGSKDLKINK